ncbi:MAG: DUF2147 domain-containing protein [Flavitalea sp.]
MIKKVTMYCLLIAGLIAGTAANAQSDKIEGTWFNDVKDAKIQIYKSNDGKFYGKIIWLKEPVKNGKPKLDEKNRNEKMQKHPIVGLMILKGFEKDGNTYDDGTIYDPENGKTYDCKITYKGKTLSIRGYVGISIFGRTTVWERAG